MRKRKRLPLTVLRPFLIDLPAEPTPFDWPALFGNAHPVEIEVGFGKGLFLVASGGVHPDINYLGLEVDRALQLYVANRLAKRALGNVASTSLSAGMRMPLPRKGWLRPPSSDHE